MYKKTVLPTFTEKLVNFLTKKHYALTDDDSMVFAITCLVLGLLVITIDWGIYHKLSKKRKKSLFDLKYDNTRGIITNYFFWGVCSGIVGFVSVMADINKMTFLGALVISITWQAVFIRIIEYISKDKEKQEVD